jgi:hypothetical protein
MTCTIWGTAAAERDVAAYYTRRGYLAEAEAFERLAEELPDDGVTITVDHGGEQVGELVFGEIDAAGRLGIVGVLHDDTILSITEPIYFSPELLVVGEGVRTRSRSIADLAGLIGMALTSDPAGLGLTPVNVRAGDVRNRADRSGWPISWKGDDPLLTRCVDTLGHHPRLTYLERHGHEQLGLGHGWVDPDGRPHHGPWHHGPAGRVIAVR